MIDPKYANLPGIAYDQPDVYETDDFPEKCDSPIYVQEDGDSVDKIYLNASEAYNKFKDKHINVESRPLSNVISNDIKEYNFSSNVALETLYKQNESVSEKFHRIKCEIEEFLCQIKTIKESEIFDRNEDARSLVDIIHQIESAGNKLSALNIEKLFDPNATTILFHNQEICFKELLSQIEIFKRIRTSDDSYIKKKINPNADKSLKQDSLKYQMTYFPEKAKIEDVARLSHLEKRIGNLESIIGITKNANSKYFQLLKTQGISLSIEKIMTCACMLNSTQLDILDNKVSTLLRKMDNVEEKKNSSGPESKYEKKISELYETMKQFENQCQILPQIINRMTSLSQLHRKACEFNIQVEELGHLRQSIHGAVLNNTTVLEEIQRNFSKNMEIIANNVTVLTERIKELKN